jgi:hypothetical protein
MKWAGVALLLAGCLISPVMTFGSGKSATEAQHDRMGELMPATLDIEGPWKGPVRTAKIRVYADDDFRAQNLKWQHVFDEWLEYANAVLGPQFGVKLVPEYHEWSHHAPGDSLDTDLTALAALDSGGDVLTVVGLTSSLSLAAATFEQLGLGALPGRYMVVRGYADLEERKAFERFFRDLSADEREQLLEARRRHKTTAVFLHELGHNLGANHEPTEDTLMNPTYSHRSATFSAEAHAAIQRTLDYRLGGAQEQLGPPPALPPPPKQAEPPPEAATGISDPWSKHRLSIHITERGTLVDGKALDDAAQVELFKQTAATDPNLEVIIHKDRAVPSITLDNTLDRAKAAGLKHLTVL